MNLKYFKNVFKTVKIAHFIKNKAMQSVKQFFPLPPRIVTASWPTTIDFEERARDSSYLTQIVCSNKHCSPNGLLS